MMTIMILLLGLLSKGRAFVAYDCGARSLNVITVSLLDIGKREVPNFELREEKVPIQLLQLLE